MIEGYVKISFIKDSMVCIEIHFGLDSFMVRFDF